MSGVEPGRTRQLEMCAEIAIGRPVGVRVHVMPLRIAGGHRVVLRMQSSADVRVDENVPADAVVHMVRDLYVQLANEVRQQLRQNLHAIGPGLVKVYRGDT